MAAPPKTLPATVSITTSTLKYVPFTPPALHHLQVLQSNNVKLIEPCAVPPGLGGKGHCTVDDLYKARPVIDDMCNFYNATIYKSYEGCPQRLSTAVTYGIIRNEGVVITQ